MKMSFRYVVAGVLLAVCLSGCGLLSRNVPASTPTPSVDLEAQQQAELDCFDGWINTEASQDVIDKGVSTTGSDGVAAVTQDSAGLHHANFGTQAFAAWAPGTPWTITMVAVQNGVGCPYDPAVKAKIAREEQECLTAWLNEELPQAAIDAGLSTTGSDASPIRPVLTRDASGVYHVDTAADGFQSWVYGNGYYVPWENIMALTLYGKVCPYGLSPEQAPSAKAS